MPSSTCLYSAYESQLHSLAVMHRQLPIVDFFQLTQSCFLSTMCIFFLFATRALGICRRPLNSNFYCLETLRKISLKSSAALCKAKQNQNQWKCAWRAIGVPSIPTQKVVFYCTMVQHCSTILNYKGNITLWIDNCDIVNTFHISLVQNYPNSETAHTTIKVSAWQ